MKLLVEFADKAELDAFFAGSAQLEPPAAVFLVNKMGQTIQLNAVGTEVDGKPSIVIEVHQRGVEIEDGGDIHQLSPTEGAFRIL